MDDSSEINFFKLMLTHRKDSINVEESKAVPFVDLIKNHNDPKHYMQQETPKEEDPLPMGSGPTFGKKISPPL